MNEQIVNALNNAIEAKLRGLNSRARTAIAVMQELGIEPPAELFDVARLEPSDFEARVTFRSE